MKKILLLLTALMLGAMGATAQCPSGSAGTSVPTSVTWELCNGVLTFSGTGVIGDYAGNNPVQSWGSNNQYQYVTSVVIENGVTSIGTLAFSGFPNLTEVAIPSSVTDIGYAAFVNCSSLTSVTVLNPMPPTLGSEDVFSDVHPSFCVQVPQGSEAAYLADSAWSKFCINGCSRGSAGANITWELCNGVLTISGTGAMADYEWSNNSPWTGRLNDITSVIINSGVTNIGDNAFIGCNNLTSVTIGNTVTSIGDQAFGFCTGLTSITIPNSVTYIGGYAFIESGLTSVTIPGSITSTGNYVFQRCVSLISAVIEEGVTSVGDAMFYNCYNLKFVTLPSSLTSFSGCMFCDCRGLISITIPSSITYIGNAAFSGCSGLTFVTFEHKDITVESGAFSNCAAIKRIEIQSAIPPAFGEVMIEDLPLDVFARACLCVPPGTITAYRAAAGWSAFGCMEELGSNYIVNFNMRGGAPIAEQTVPANSKAVQPANPTHYGYTFGGWYTDETCTNAWDFNTAVTGNITLHAKWNGSCTNFTAYGTAGNMSWSLCNGKLTINGEGDMPNDYYSWSYGYDNFRSVFTSVAIDNRITSIGEQAFVECTGLTSVTIPNSVTTIGGSAFSSCTGLTSVTIPNSVTTIGYGAFYGCTGLTTITIPNGVTSIGSNMFSSCTGLTSVNIPNGVTSIGSYAFSSCVGLTSITIPSGVTSIGGSAFSNCTNLTIVTVLNPAPPTVGTTIFGSMSLSSRTLRVPCGALANYPNAAPWNFGTRQELPANNNSVVFNARGGTPVAAQIIAAGGKAIQPANPTHYGYTFGGWYTEEACTTAWNFNNVVTVNTMLYAKWNGGSCSSSFTAYGATGSMGWSLCSGTLTISGEGAMPNDYSSSSAPWYGNRASITSVVLDSRITSIGNYAFQGCTGLTSITIPNSVTSINYYSFSGCTGLTSVTIPNSVTTIGQQAFRDCIGLTSVNIPNGVYSIQPSAFQGCTGLTSVNIPTSVTSIGSSAFYGCSSLASITIPTSVTSIGSNAFQGCTGLTSITIPTSVTSISNSAFQGCTNLSSITSLRLTPPTASSNTFTNVPSGCCLYVPATALNAYASATGWSQFTTCRLALPSAYYTVTFDVQGGNTYPTIPAQSIEQGQMAQQPATNPTRNGYIFGGWYKEPECTIQWYFATDVVNDNLTLYAKWTQALIVSFNAQGGSPAPAAQQLESGQLAQQPTSNPTRNGYVFGGWFKEAVCTTPWNFATDVVSYSIALYAQWIPLYTVSFNAQGGSPTPAAQQVEEGQTVSQPAAPTRASYTFAGWYTNVAYTTAWNFSTDVVSANTTLYAKWISNSVTIFTVTFNSQSGSAVSSQQVEQGGNAAQPGNPVREGLTFGGWFKDQACTQVWDFHSEAVNANVTLYALWQCAVLFNPNGGSAVPAQLVSVGGTASAPTAPKHSNYNFVGWYSDLCLATPYSFGSAVQGNITLYAKWTPK